MADKPSEPEQPKGPNIIIQPEQMAGVWANFARVGHSQYEFTVDFARLDFSTNPPQGIVVSRVSLSPLFVTQLIDALSDNWQKYARKSLPKEVYRGEGQPPEGERPIDGGES